MNREAGTSGEEKKSITDNFCVREDLPIRGMSEAVKDNVK